MNNRDISPHWFWLPFGLVVAQLVSRYFMDDVLYRRYVGGAEIGAVEWLTPISLLPAVIFGLIVLTRMRQALPTLNSRIWIAMTALGAFYMAGEEVSWGQWIFYWDTPEAFLEINDQEETNLHNTSSWLDQKPRLLLELWVLAGAIRVWYRNFRGKQDDPSGTAYWFWPTLPLAWVGLLSAAVMLPERMKDWWDIKLPSPFDIRVTETQELVLGCYLSLFLASVFIRLKARSAGKVK